ncbi:hypothetical protein [Streptomyces sp. NBC_00299]|uniref:hypothetical protein n=1 Tax=Streptomyces sp. NBC_00299 TaxID=2975705 RepID=UPI002E2DA2BA|nr:hypothetical protein [Streptomyces sp. NBC_00299]
MSDELSAALRELAAAEATQPVAAGAEIRGRALRRRRRRRVAATLGAGTAGLTALAVALTLHLGGTPHDPDRLRTPAATPADPSLPSAPTPTSPEPVSGTLDLPGRTLTFGGRLMSVLWESAHDAPVLPTTSMTVVTKQEQRDLPVDIPSKDRAVVDVPYVVELRDDKDQPLYVGAFTSQLKALTGFRVGGGLIALGPEDAKSFYARVGLGERISVSTGATPTSTPTADPSAAVSVPGEEHQARPNRPSRT